MKKIALHMGQCPHCMQTVIIQPIIQKKQLQAYVVVEHEIYWRGGVPVLSLDWDKRGQCLGSGKIALYHYKLNGAMHFTITEQHYEGVNEE